jgi:hypothetical protein
MNTGGQSFLNRLTHPPADGFAVRFSKISAHLGLGVCLSESELSFLYKATFYATLCNIAFNGLGGCGGLVKPGREANRLSLEREFMAARDIFWASEGWRALPATQKESIRNVFLHVVVVEDNLAS